MEVGSRHGKDRGVYLFWRADASPLTDGDGLERHRTSMPAPALDRCRSFRRDETRVPSRRFGCISSAPAPGISACRTALLLWAWSPWGCVPGGRGRRPDAGLSRGLAAAAAAVAAGAASICRGDRVEHACMHAWWHGGMVAWGHGAVVPWLPILCCAALQRGPCRAEGGGRGP